MSFVKKKKEKPLGLSNNQYKDSLSKEYNSKHSMWSREIKNILKKVGLC